MESSKVEETPGGWDYGSASSPNSNFDFAQQIQNAGMDKNSDENAIKIVEQEKPPQQ